MTMSDAPKPDLGFLPFPPPETKGGPVAQEVGSPFRGREYVPRVEYEHIQKDLAIARADLQGTRDQRKADAMGYEETIRKLEESLRWRRSVRRRFVFGFVFGIVLGLLYIVFRIATAGTAYGERARQNAAREARAFVTVTYGVPIADVACTHRVVINDWIRCDVRSSAGLVYRVFCDDDEPGHNDGCTTPSNERDR